MKSNERLVLGAAINTFGEDQQIEMIIEECSELIHALQRYKRDPCLVRRVAVIEELADAKIMVFQGCQIFDPVKVETVVAQKVKRLEQRIHDHINGVKKNV